jgi:tRNA(Ile)-lysidine synthase TilS/MesJ
VGDFLREGEGEAVMTGQNFGEDPMKREKGEKDGRDHFGVAKELFPERPANSCSAIALLSGGLDSSLAVKMMIDQGIAVTAVHFTSPFCNCTSKKAGCKHQAVKVAHEFGIPVQVIHKGMDYMRIVENPPHGYGRGLNPCIDCRIYMLKKVKERSR